MRLLAITCLILGAASFGCGTATPGTVKVTGTVTKGGQPVTGATVVFTPASGRPATGITDGSGKFVLSTFGGGDGALPGEHKISVTKTSVEPPPMPGTEEAENQKPEPPPFNEMFTNPDTSGLRVTVESGGENDFSFEVTD